MMPDELDQHGPSGTRDVGAHAIKWGAVVVIVLAVLYFLAQYVVPLFQ